MEKSVHTNEYLALLAELRNARSISGLSQRDLAKRLKIPHSWVAKVESGERRIDMLELFWFFSACGVDPLEVCERLMRKWRTMQPRRHNKEEHLK